MPNDKEKTACFKSETTKECLGESKKYLNIFLDDTDENDDGDFADSDLDNISLDGNDRQINDRAYSQNIISSNGSSTQPNSKKINDGGESNPNTKNNKLNLLNIPKNMDFNDEFLENYEDFSPSWRNEVDKMVSSNLKYNYLFRKTYEK
jgi:hypothetical protein